LEDHHLPGVSLSHWETRLLGNDLMTPTYTNAFALSKLTLALMEDTGRQSTAPFCYDSQLTRPASPVHVSCLPGGSSFGYCNLVRHRETLPPEYTYFASPNPFKTYFSLASASGLLSAPGEGGDCNLGGKVEMANFCPFVQLPSIPRFLRRQLSKCAPGFDLLYLPA
uniref:Leishmanolysin-like peptidase n=1 Tax=Schistocephalus solidus TaxID=70667 RepID=A0A183SDI6_SCHSO